MRDQEIARQLARRAGGGEWRADRVLPAVRRAMGEPRTQRVGSQRWAAAASLLGLIGVLLVLAVALPNLALGPAASPTSDVERSASPTDVELPPSPAPDAPPAVLSTAAFVARLATGELNGSTVLVRGGIGEERAGGAGGSPPCLPDDEECLDIMGRLIGATDDVPIARAAIATPEEEAIIGGGPRGGWHWWTRPAPPVEGILVLSVTEYQDVEYVGRLQPSAAALPLTADEAAKLDVNSLALDEIVLVGGWLTQVGGAISCRPPDPGTVLDGLPSKWCGNPAWIAPEPMAIDPSGFTVPDDFISVQHGAYLQFADHPAVNENELLEPRWATYAIARRLYGGGCPDNAPPCWDWQIVARVSVGPSDPAVTLAPPVTQAPETPLAEAPAASLTCAQVTRGGRPATEPSPTLRVIDYTHRIEGCMYVWRPDALDGNAMQVVQESPSSVEVTWAVDQICDSDVTIDFSGDEQAYDMAIAYSPGASCRDGSGVEGFLMWFDRPLSAESVEAYLDRLTPPPATPPAPPSRRIECVEILAPPASSDRRSGIYVTDHSGVVKDVCQSLGAEVGDFGGDVRVTNPSDTNSVLAIWWQVPEVCDYMPAELEIWPADDGLLVHIDRKVVDDRPRACLTAFGRQGLALNLHEPVMASSVETLLTTDGSAMSIVDMPAGMTFSLSLHANKTEYAVDEPINVEATLAYHGATGETVNAWGNGYVWFRVERVDGELRMEPLQMMICQRLEPLEASVPRTTPFFKGGYALPDPGDPNAHFLRRYWEDPELRLPTGLWRITASSSFGVGDCGRQQVSLEAEIIVHVR